MALRLLVAAGGTVSGAEELPFGVRELVEAADEVLVVTPVLPGRFEWLASATDAARDFHPDHLLIALRAKERAGWQERGLLDQIQERFSLPVTVFSVSED